MGLCRKIEIGLFAGLGSCVGALVARASGCSVLPFIANAIAWMLGVALVNSPKAASFLIRHQKIFSVSAVIIIFISLMLPGMDSVHRWIPLGPFSLNVSMALTHLVLFGIVAGSGWFSLGLSLILSVIFVLQPDAGQATAFTTAVILVFLMRTTLLSFVRWSGILGTIALSALTWTRPDPLPAVESVERILHLAGNQGIVSSSASALAIAFLFIPFVRILREKNTPISFIFAASATVLLATSFLVTEMGNFPVPILGAGAAPVLGWFFSFTLLSE